MALIRRYYSSGEVAALAEVTYRRLDLWVRRELIRSSGRRAAGKGQRRLFTFNDVIEVRTLKALTAKGVRLAALTQCIQQLRRHMDDNIERSFASIRLVTDGTTVFRYVPSKDHLESLDAYSQFAFAFGLGEEISLMSIRASKLDRSSRYTRRSVNEDVRPTIRRRKGA